MAIPAKVSYAFLLFSRQRFLAEQKFPTAGVHRPKTKQSLQFEFILIYFVGTPQALHPL